jgi:tripartite-type tricarboxylate transporter receptor subunit TctC
VPNRLVLAASSAFRVAGLGLTPFSLSPFPFSLLAAALLGALAGSEATAQEFPSKTIRVIVPYPPGGPTDIHARVVAQELNKAWGQPVVIENRPGAAGMIGTEVAARAPTDGYTLCTAGVTFSTSELLGRMSFSPTRELAPIALLGAVPNILVIHPSLPVRTVKELVALARSHPKGLLYPSGGPGGVQALAGAYFEHLSGTKLVEVQYKGSIPGITALVSGEVQFGFTDLITTLPQVETGKLKLLAVTGLKRSPMIPKTPTVAESGLPGFNVTAWFGLVTRAETPRPIIDKLGREVLRILQLPDTQTRLTRLGSDPGTLGPAEFGEFIAAESKKWAKVIDAGGLRQP